MLPNTTTEPGSAAVTDRRADAPGGCQTEPNILEALLDALNGSGSFRLVDRGGELFLEPRRSYRPAARLKSVAP